MTADPGVGLLAELARVSTNTATPDDLLAHVLPMLLACSGARAGLVLRRSADGHSLAAHAGTALDPDALPDEVALEAGRSVEVPVPTRWAASAITRVAARALPGEAGVLLLAWGPEQQRPTPLLEPALVLIEATLARRHAEGLLTDLVARVDNAQGLANMGDYDWHIVTDTNRWSDQLYRIYGHPPQSFNPSYERFLEHIYPEDRDRITGIHQHSYATGEPYEMVERIVRPDGEIRHLASNGQVIRDAGGTPVRMRGTCIDITDRVVAEEARERIAARFRGLVESCPDAILVLDGGRRIVQANGRATGLLGADPVGHDLGEISPGPLVAGTAIEATGLDGRALLLDVTLAELSQVPDEGLVAAFLHDAAPRLAGEALAATLREAQSRRQQALELNDNIVQGLTAAALTLQMGDLTSSSRYLEMTLAAARHLMNDWLNPLSGEDLQPGDLVRTIPSTLDEDSARITAADPVATEVVGPRRILVADDNQVVRDLLRAQLVSTGKYDVVGVAGDGEEAVRLAVELRPEIVLLDLSMPHMDGLQALPLILQGVPGVRVIVLSGFDQGQMADKALIAGASRYVEKGLRMDLDAVIDSVLHPA